jgi:putative transposase
VKFAFIHAEKAYFEVSALCRNLGVSRQGYYAYSKRKPGPREAREQALQQRLRALHSESGGRYGSPRLLRALRKEGQRVAKRRVERAMRSMGLRGCARRRFRVTTKANPTHGVVENSLDRQFNPPAPNQRWVTDITYLWTNEGWCYLAVILDLFSRAVVGWSIDANLSTSLPLRALEMALLRRRPEPGLLHHSDRGCQYTSADYLAVLHSHGITVSMSRRGNCWDNAVAESFFATLKTELIYDRIWQSRAEVRAAIFEYIEVFYNRQRLHSTLGYKTPHEIETQHAALQAA